MNKLESIFQARRAESRARSESREFSNRSSAMNYERARTPPFDPAVDPLNVSAFARYKQTLLDSANALKGESERRQLDAMSRRSAEVREKYVQWQFECDQLQYFHYFVCFGGSLWLVETREVLHFLNRSLFN